MQRLMIAVAVMLWVGVVSILIAEATPLGSGIPRPETDPHSSKRWDVVVLDVVPTGFVRFAAPTAAPVCLVAALSCRRDRSEWRRRAGARPSIQARRPALG